MECERKGRTKDESKGFWSESATVTVHVGEDLEEKIGFVLGSVELSWPLDIQGEMFQAGHKGVKGWIASLANLRDWQDPSPPDTHTWWLWKEQSLGAGPPAQGRPTGRLWEPPPPPSVQSGEPRGDNRKECLPPCQAAEKSGDWDPRASLWVCSRENITAGLDGRWNQW